ncbi:hypothetical protein ACFQZE_06685 [Paenibacillus sp. GCM10027627]|uniref:hypothetical protein n=1 Tax=unclassified Paenibacillus TaxID=185978 RepID=UPI00362F6635
MKYTLLENGIDSLKATHNNIEKMKELQEGSNHCLKDSILSLNHAIEILLKLILKDHNEYLVFSDLDKYMTAKAKMIQQGKTNIFEVNENLKTITLHECINRVQFLCDIPISDQYKTVISFMNKKRNEITHYEINLSAEELKELIDQLELCYELSIDFFKQHIEDLEVLLEDARFEMTTDDYEEAMSDMYADMAYEQYREDQLMYR